MNKDSLPILIVEDNPTLRLLICKQLDIFDLCYEEAINGQVAIENFYSKTYALILMDVMMPVMSGLTSTKAIREIESQTPEKMRTPIIGITAYSDIAACQSAGMDDFLFKPVLLEQMSQIIQKWLPNKVSDEHMPKRIQSSYNTIKTLTEYTREELRESAAHLNKIQQHIDELKNRFGL